MAASIEDVARLAGVSIATVSRALRGLPDVATATRDRVLAAAEKLDYVASPFAARLASGRTATVGVVVPFVDRWFFAVVIDTVERALRLAGYDLLLYNLGDEQGRTTFFASMPMRKRVDALIVVSLVLSEEEFDSLASMDIPVGPARPRPRGHHLDPHRRRRRGAPGRRPPALARAPPDRLDRRRHRGPDALHTAAAPANRLPDALREAGVVPDPELEVLGYFTADGGTEATERLLAAARRPTAIFAESDEMAFGALRAIRRFGLKVPRTSR